MADEFQGPARVVGRENGFSGQKSFEGNVTQVFALGRYDDEARPGVQADELLVVDPRHEAHALGDAEPRGETPDAIFLGASSDQNEARPGGVGERGDRQVRTLPGDELADRKGVVPGRTLAVTAHERRRMVEGLTRDPVEPLQARGDVARIGEHAPGLRQSDPVDLLDRLARASVLRGRGEVAVGSPELVVGLAVLVNEPDDLVVVARGVRREARRDDRVDPPPPDFLDVQAPPGERAANQIEAVPLDQGHRHEVRLHPAPRELLGQPAHVPFGPSLGEGRLNRQDEHPGRLHGRETGNEKRKTRP